MSSDELFKIIGWHIPYESLRELCPTEVERVEQHPDFKSWGELAQQCDEDNFHELPIALAFLQLESKFSEVTAHPQHPEPLQLRLYYVPPDSTGYEGSGVEPHQQCLFGVDKVITMNRPALKLFQAGKLFSFHFMV